MAEREGEKVADYILGDQAHLYDGNFKLSLGLAVWRTVWRHEAEQRKKK